MKIIYITIGIICMGLGGIGVLLPILPTTPFLLLASFCFARGSTKFENWFVGTKLYKKYLASFIKERSMPLKTKIIVLSLASTMLLIAFFSVHVIYARISILAVIAYKYYYFIAKIKTEKV